MCPMPLRQLEILHRNKPCSVHRVCLSMTTKTYSKLTLDPPREQACNYTIVLLHGLQKKMKLTINQYLSYTLFKNAKTSPKWWFSTFLHGKQWIMRTSKNFGAIFLIGSLPTTRPLSQKKQFLASWKVTNHQGAGSIARRSQWWKMRQACQSVWKICKNDSDVVIFWNYCTALRVYNLYTWYFSRVKALNSFQCWVEVVKFWHFKEPFSCLHRPLRFFFHKSPGTSMRSIYSHPFQSWLKLKDISSCFLLKKGDVCIFCTFTCKPTILNWFWGDFCCFPFENFMLSRFLRLPRSLLSANPRGETGDQRQGSEGTLPCNRATSMGHVTWQAGECVIITNIMVKICQNDDCVWICPNENLSCHHFSTTPCIQHDHQLLL